MLMIYNRCSPIDDASLNLEPAVVKVKKSGETWNLADPKQIPWVLAMQPATHKLTVRWALKQTSIDPGPATATGPTAAPPDDPYNKGTGDADTSDAQGAPERLFARPPFEGDVMASLLRAGDAKGRPIESPDLAKVKWSPGKWLLTVEVKDEMFYDVGDPLTKKKIKVPWVVKDEQNSLVERRAWELVIRE
jgi:hypothetical protein